jgi:hypothetical protein
VIRFQRRYSRAKCLLATDQQKLADVVATPLWGVRIALCRVLDGSQSRGYIAVTTATATYAPSHELRRGKQRIAHAS